MFNRFLPDYGVLPSAYFKRSAISNPIELFWSNDLCSLLRLCGEKEENIGERASDFDKFKAILRALPFLEGHPTRTWIETLFDKYFNLKELPQAENTSEIWKLLCDRLLKNPLA
ncbi:MAG: glucuronate isomerase, partial [Clostridia bacterium]|nr:glucuronate isomerase [Clostridia bacterium]